MTIKISNIFATNKVIFSSFCLILFLLGVAGFFLSFISFETIKSYINLSSSDGDVESFTAERFQSIVFKLKLVSSILLVIVSVFLFFSKRILKFTDQTAFNAINYAKQQLKYFNFLFQKENRIQAVLLLTCIIVGSGLRFNRLFQPTGYDEAFSYLYFIKRPLIIGLADYSYPNNHLFHTFLSHISCSIFGNDLWVIRLPAFIAGILIIPFIYILGKKLMNGNVGLLAAACCAVAAPLIDFSVIARGYTIVTLFYIISFILAYDIKTKQKGAATWFTLVSILGLYTVPIYLQALLIQLIWIIVTDKTNLKKAIFSSAIIFIVTLLLYLPPVITTGLKSVIQNDTLMRYPYPDLLRRWNLTLGWLQQDWLKGWFSYNLILIGLGLFVSFFKKESRKLLLISILVITILSIIQQNVAPTRGWLHHLPVFFICSASGIVWVVEKLNFSFVKFIPPLIVILLLLNAIKIKNLRAETWGEIAETETVAIYLKENLKEGDKVISLMPTDYPLEYYFLKHAIDLHSLHKDNANSNRFFIIINPTSNQSLQQIEEINANNSVILKQFEYNTVYLHK